MEAKQCVGKVCFRALSGKGQTPNLTHRSPLLLQKSPAIIIGFWLDFSLGYDSIYGILPLFNLFIFIHSLFFVFIFQLNYSG